MFLVGGGLLLHRTLPAPAAAPIRATASTTPDMAVSRGEPVAKNAADMLAQFPRDAPGHRPDGPCADSTRVMSSSRALAERIAEPLSTTGAQAAAPTASDWNSLVFMARLLRNAQRAQTRMQAAGCIPAPRGGRAPAP